MARGEKGEASMKITEELRDSYDPHLSVKSGSGWPQGRNPPLAVYAALAALVKPPISASLVNCDSRQGKTTWFVWVLTESALARVVVEFDSECYDGPGETNRMANKAPAFEDERPAGAQVVEAWAQKLSGDHVRAQLVTGTDYVKAQADWFPVPQIRLTFADEREVTIPGENPHAVLAERDESEKFLDAILKRIQF
jgi:hypothetical protein